MQITPKEVVEVSKLDSKARYIYFIKRLADFETFFTIKNVAGNYALSVLEGRTIFHMWSAKEFAELCLMDEWKDYKVEKISLDIFEDEIFDFLESNSILIDVFPVRDKTGFVVSTDEFVRDLREELNNYL